jgi:hypothetical protein
MAKPQPSVLLERHFFKLPVLTAQRCFNLFQ